MLTRAKRKRIDGQFWSHSAIDPRTKKARVGYLSCSLLDTALDQGRAGTCINHSYSRAMYYRAKLHRCYETKKCWSKEHMVSTARHDIPKNLSGRSLLIMKQIFDKTNKAGINLRRSEEVVKARDATFISRHEEPDKAEMDKKLVAELEENGPFVIRFAMFDHFRQRRGQESRDFIYVSSPPGSVHDHDEQRAPLHCVVVTGHGVREGDGLSFWEYQNSAGPSFNNVSALPDEKGLGLGRVAKDSVLVAVIPHDCRVCSGGESTSAQQE